MAGLNKIMVIGNVGTDPEMRYTPNGSPVTSFRIATTRTYNNQGGERIQETEWFTVVAWNQLAEQVNQYLSWGAGPRASQYLIIAAKCHAAFEGKYSPDIDNVRAVALPILRHRIVRNYKAEADGVTVESLIDRLK